MSSCPREYIRAVRTLGVGNVVHQGSVLVDCATGGEKRWKGYVEVFEVEGDAISKRAFAWKWDEAHCVAVLSSPRIQSPHDAVRVARGRSRVEDRTA